MAGFHMADSQNRSGASSSSAIDELERKFIEQENKSVQARHIGGLEEYTPGTEESKNAEHRVLSELRVKKRVRQEVWEDRPEYHETNAFGLPKKMRPSQAIKQEWPPKEETPAKEVIPEKEIEPSATNALGLPKDWAETRVPAKPLPRRPAAMIPQGEEKTNALGIPLHWFERQLAQEDEENQKEQIPAVTPEEIENIKKQAHEEGFAAGHSEGLAQGHQEGFAKGHAEGVEAGNKEGYDAGIARAQEDMADQVAFFATAAEKLAHPQQELNDAVATSLVDLALRLTRQMISFGAAKNGSYILDALKRAMAQLPSAQEGAEIVVNSHDAAFLNEHYSPEDLAREGWNIKIDDTLPDGDLRVTARNSEITLKLSDQIDSLIREFIRANFS